MLSIICQEIHSKVTTCSVPMLHMENPHPSQKGAKDGGLDFLKRERHVCAFACTELSLRTIVRVSLSR